MDYIFKGRSDREFVEAIAQLKREGRDEDAKAVQHFFDAWKKRRPEGDRPVENWQPPDSELPLR